MRPALVLSGGQTGADRGGLDAAIELGLKYDGWIPRGRRAEDGTVPERYALRESPSPLYQQRTRLNVAWASAVLVFAREGALGPGSDLTVRLACSMRRSYKVVTLERRLFGDPKDIVLEFLERERPSRLLVAGSRESSAPGIQAEVAALLVDLWWKP